MQLHRLPPRPTELSGIYDAFLGVEEPCARRASWKAWLALALGLCALLGQGERCRIDPALRSPGSAIASYWEAIQLNDPDAMWACSLDRDGRLPYPGMLWAFPATTSLSIEALRYMPVDDNEVMVSYDVCFKAIGDDRERTLHVMTDLVCWRGEWRVSRPLAEYGLMSGRALPTRVDI